LQRRRLPVTAASTSMSTHGVLSGTHRVRRGNSTMGQPLQERRVLRADVRRGEPILGADVRRGEPILEADVRRGEPILDADGRRGGSILSRCRWAQVPSPAPGAGAGAGAGASTGGEPTYCLSFRAVSSSSWRRGPTPRWKSAATRHIRSYLRKPRGAHVRYAGSDSEYGLTPTHVCAGIARAHARARPNCRRARRGGTLSTHRVLCVLSCRRSAEPAELAD
jgi:hypothetical protein